MNIYETIRHKQIIWISEYKQDPDTIIVSYPVYVKLIQEFNQMMPANMSLSVEGKHKYMGMEIIWANITDDDIRVSKTKLL